MTTVTLKPEKKKTSLALKLELAIQCYWYLIQPLFTAWFTVSKMSRQCIWKFIHANIYFYEGALSVTVIVIRTSNLSSNPGWGCLRFTSNWFSGEKSINLSVLLPAIFKNPGGLGSSFVHLKNGTEHLMREIAQVFIHLMRLLLYNLVSSFLLQC